jgi:hypothetical protein
LQQRLNALLEQRQRLIESSVAKATSSTAHAHGEDGKGSEMLEMEAARLDMLWRRQERELQQLEKHELARKAIQVFILFMMRSCLPHWMHAHQ